MVSSSDTLRPEAQTGGLLALVEDDDIVLIDAQNRVMELKVPEEEIERRRQSWNAPPLKFTKGTLYKYAKCVSSASEGCVTDE